MGIIRAPRAKDRENYPPKRFFYQSTFEVNFKLLTLKVYEY